MSYKKVDLLAMEHSFSKLSVLEQWMLEKPSS
jgi:hypothetical protein